MPTHPADQMPARLTSAEYVERLQSLLGARELAIVGVIGRARWVLARQIAARLARPPAPAPVQEPGLYEARQAEAVRQFEHELQALQALLQRWRHAYTSDELFWDDEGVSASLRRIGATFAPQVRQADAARVHGMLAEIAAGAADLALSGLERERLIQGVGTACAGRMLLRHFLAETVLLRQGSADGTEPPERFAVHRIGQTAEHGVVLHRINHEPSGDFRYYRYPLDADTWEYDITTPDAIDLQRSVVWRVVVRREEHAGFLELLDHETRCALDPEHHHRRRSERTLPSVALRTVRGMIRGFFDPLRARYRSHYWTHATMRLPCVPVDDSIRLLPIVHARARSYALRTELLSPAP